jgi:dihydroorotase
LFDATTEFVFQCDAMRSRGRNSPFDGVQLRGRVKQVLVDGRVVFEEA